MTTTHAAPGSPSGLPTDDELVASLDADLADFELRVYVALIDAAMTACVWRRQDDAVDHLLDLRALITRRGR